MRELRIYVRSEHDEAVELARALAGFLARRGYGARDEDDAADAIVTLSEAVLDAEGDVEAFARRVFAGAAFSLIVKAIG